MVHPVLSTLRPVPPAAPPGRVVRTAAWAARPDSGPAVAVLITACRDIAATVRCYRTLLPTAEVVLYGDDLPPETIAAGEASGATVRVVPASGRNALVRRMLAEVDADIYILAHGAGPDDACLAPLIVAEIGDRDQDLVDVSRLGGGDLAGDAGDRLLARTVDFLFGRGGDMLASDVKACSRRFAVSYRAVGSGDAGLASAPDLALHALRLRLPVCSVAALGRGPAADRTCPARTIAGWMALLGLVGRLLVEERPRRVLGLTGLALVAAGIATALPALTIDQWRATLPLCPATLVALALMGGGAGVGAAGAALDSLAAARQEVKRVGVAAIPRRAEPRRP